MELQHQDQPMKEVPKHSRQMFPKEPPASQNIQQIHHAQAQRLLYA